MEATSFLIFKLRDARYAVEAPSVCEIVPLPEIIPLEETPAYIVGIVNLRGQIVPVMDLNLRFGHPAQRFCLEDCVVFLERAGRAIGIIVNEVLNVRDLAPDARLPLPSYGTETQPDPQFLTGLANAGEQIVMLLHLENLLHLATDLNKWRGAEGIMPPTSADAFCPDASPEERAVFRERACSLAPSIVSAAVTGLPLAVVRLGEEFFGIELQAIREFAELRSVTPVPCCPPHIVGQMNLRGDLITLLEIAGVLGLPPSRGQAGRKVVVVNSAELGAGVLVDEVRDVLSLHTADITPASVAFRVSGREYLRGTALHGTQMLSLLDLPALLRHESLIVNEKP